MGESGITVQVQTLITFTVVQMIIQHYMGVFVWMNEENFFERLHTVVDTMIYDKVNRVSFAACGKELKDHKVGQRVREAPH